MVSRRVNTSLHVLSYAVEVTMECVVRYSCGATPCVAWKMRRRWRSVTPRRVAICRTEGSRVPARRAPSATACSTAPDTSVTRLGSLRTLVRHPRQPLSRDKLAQLARGREFEPFDRSLDVQISRLRKMIEPDPAQPRYIQTVWGVGYVFVPDGTA